MHPADFFRRRGLFCQPDFLDERARAGLLQRARSAIPTPARVFDGRPDAVVDMSVRNTWQVPVDEDTDLTGRIAGLLPELARHFDVPLAGNEGPTLLMYPPGGFYEPHADRATDTERKPGASRRRVSVVIFLNGASAPPDAGGYAGGALTFYGLVDDPAWRRFGFAIEPTPGLLVAFPSHLVHEVTPVTAGDRYTVVDWFTA